MNLIEMTNKAIRDVHVFREPDIDDWLVAIDPILESAGECTIGEDSVESISLTEAGVHITTSFTSRGCPMISEMYLPRRVLESEDPIKAANIYRINNRILDVKNELSYARDKTVRYGDKLAELVAELNSFENA